MNKRYLKETKNEPIELGQLLSSTIKSVVDAQQQLDIYTEKRKREYEQKEKGSLAIPPLWYVFKNVSVELELSANIGEVISEDESSKDEPYLFCKTLNQASVGLYGYEASAGLKVRVELGPQGIVPIKEIDAPENEL